MRLLDIFFPGKAAELPHFSVPVMQWHSDTVTVTRTVINPYVTINNKDRVSIVINRKKTLIFQIGNAGKFPVLGDNQCNDRIARLQLFCPRCHLRFLRIFGIPTV